MACKRTGPDTELFIVEGDSAARSVRRARNPDFQAVFAMQGKPMNATKCSIGQLHGNAQFAALIHTLGVQRTFGARGEPQAGSTSELNYGRVNLLFDPDPDGIHGRTLMLLFFYRWLPSLLDEGRVSDIHAPQWEITGVGMEQPAYAATPDHMREVRAALSEQGITGLQWKCFRGLGSVDTELLESRCVNPTTRESQVLTSGDAERALALFEQMRVLGAQAPGD